MSILIVDKKLLFHHIPRTGGTTVQRTIRHLDWKSGRAARKHFLLQHYSRFKKQEINRVFTFVRNPFSYYESVWKWLKVSEKNLSWLAKRDWHPHCTAARLYCRDFNYWVFSMLENEPCWVTRLYEQYCGPQGAEFCSFIGRTETLLPDLQTVLAKYGVIKKTQSLPAVENQHVLMDSIVWNEEVRCRVQISEKLVFQRFYSEHTKDVRFYSPELMK